MAMTIIAIRSSITAKAVKNTFIELGTREPNAVITPMANAISVAVGIAHPWTYTSLDPAIR